MAEDTIAPKERYLQRRKRVVALCSQDYADYTKIGKKEAITRAWVSKMAREGGVDKNGKYKRRLKRVSFNANREEMARVDAIIAKESTETTTLTRQDIFKRFVSESLQRYDATLTEGAD